MTEKDIAAIRVMAQENIISASELLGKTAKLRQRFGQLANAGQPLSQHDQMHILTVAFARFPAVTTCVVAYKTEVPRSQDRSFNEMVNYLLHHIEAFESIISVQEAGCQVAIHKMEALERDMETISSSSRQQQPGCETRANPVPDRTDTAGDVDTTMCTREFNAG
jgi:hypothetical protein